MTLDIAGIVRCLVWLFYRVYFRLEKSEAMQENDDLDSREAWRQL